MFERKGFNIDITEEDKKALAEGTVDYIGFSYYMTNVVDSTVTKMFQNQQMVQVNIQLKTHILKNQIGDGLLIQKD